MSDLRIGGFQPPAHFNKPYRVLVMGGPTRAWSDATADQRKPVLARMRRLFREWEALGMTVLATFDDDIFSIGEPLDGFHWYLTLEVPDTMALAVMLNRLKSEEEGVRVDRYFRVEAKVGRGFYPLEDGLS